MDSSRVVKVEGEDVEEAVVAEGEETEEVRPQEEITLGEVRRSLAEVLPRSHGGTGLEGFQVGFLYF